MRTLLLASLLIWTPFRHVESGTVYVDIQGHGTVVFKKPFKRHPACSAVSRTTHQKSTPFAWHKEGAMWKGTPGDILDWTCKHNPKGPK
jgi:hypothetical protein